MPLPPKTVSRRGVAAVRVNLNRSSNGSGIPDNDTLSPPLPLEREDSDVYGTSSAECSLRVLNGMSQPPSCALLEVSEAESLWTHVVQTIVAFILWLCTFGLRGHLPWQRLKLAPPFLAPTSTLTKEEIGRLLKSIINLSVNRARRIAQPLLRIDTEFENESEGDMYSPLSHTLHGAVELCRAQANEHICNRLREVPTHELESNFRVHACSWNVDKQSPPPYSIDFIRWLLGPELAEKVATYQDRRRHERDGQTSRSPTLFPASATNEKSTSSRMVSAMHPQSDLPSTLQSLLKDLPDLIVVSLQEVDMGSVALVKESTDCSVAWAEAIIDALHTATDCKLNYRKMKVVQLVGLVLIVLVQVKHVDYITHIRLSLTRTGVMRVLGNKGSVAMRATIYGKRFLFIAAHFAAHKYNELQRAKDYRASLSDISFPMAPRTDDESEVLRTFVKAANPAACALNHSIRGRGAWGRLFKAMDGVPQVGEESIALDEHDYIFFLGDLNSRLHGLEKTDIRRFVAAGEHDYLLCHDELLQGMISGDVFDGFEEPRIYFPPTYKFDRGTSTYDTSRKMRDPAWCDRVLFRVFKPNPVEGYSDSARGATSDGSDAGTSFQDRGRVSSPKAQRGCPKEDSNFRSARRPCDLRKHTLRFPMISNKATVAEYYSVGELCMSDHRPIGLRVGMRVLNLRPQLVHKILQEFSGCAGGELFGGEANEQILTSTKGCAA